MTHPTAVHFAADTLPWDATLAALDLLAAQTAREALPLSAAAAAHALWWAQAVAPTLPPPTVLLVLPRDRVVFRWRHAERLGIARIGAAGWTLRVTAGRQTLWERQGPVPTGDPSALVHALAQALGHAPVSVVEGLRPRLTAAFTALGGQTGDAVITEAVLQALAPLLTATTADTVEQWAASPPAARLRTQLADAWVAGGPFLLLQPECLLLAILLPDHRQEIRTLWDAASLPMEWLDGLGAAWGLNVGFR